MKLTEREKMKKVILSVFAGLFLIATLSSCESSDTAKKVNNAIAEVTFEGQAERAAKNYLSMLPFSRQGLIKQLEFEGYSSSEAANAVDSLNIDYNEQAYRAAKNYLSMMPFSERELIQQLEFEGYTTAQAIAGVSRIG